MADLIITERSNITTLADKIRSLMSETNEITLGDMIEHLETANVDKGEIIAALKEFGVEVKDNASLSEVADLVREIDAGINTFDADATADDILRGKTAYVDGEKIIGTIDTKTASDLSTSEAKVTVPAGYYSSQATVSISTIAQATPSITVDAKGLITATAAQSAGYVVAGTQSATYQLAFQPAKTITPTTVNQTAVSSGYYTGGKITVKGDSNLVASNIKKGVSIFGVSGTLDTSIEDAFVNGTISGTYENSRVTTVGKGAFFSNYNIVSVNFPKATTMSGYAFYLCDNLTTVSFPVVENVAYNAFRGTNLSVASFPAATTIGSKAFSQCYSLTSANFPKVTTIGSCAFYDCYKLVNISFPKATRIYNEAFWYCTSLTTASFPKANYIYSNAFSQCSKLSSIYLLGSSVCNLYASNAFISTGITSSKGSIFVCPSLVSSYKSATNWVYFSNRIFAYEE